MDNHQPPASQPPSGLADVLNPANEQRDSAYYSSGSGDASKHTSVVSNTGHVHTGSSAGINLETKTPPPNSTLSFSKMSPTTNTSMSVAAIMSPRGPPTPSGIGPDRSMLDKLNSRPGDTSQRSSCVSSIADSRRDSVDSRSINNGLDQMRISGSSPYGSHHPSTTSIQASYQNQRDPRNGPERLSASRFPQQNYNSNRNSDSHGKQGRMAPVISGPSAPQFAHNHIPVAGQAWAGPFGEDDRGPPHHASSIADSSRKTSFLDSRRNSIAESFTSNVSQLTTESALPRGQRRLDEGYPESYTPKGHNSTDLATTHHHQLKHKQLGDVMDQDGASPGGSSQPYSRTPELRVSHKLAERKRRDEMKQLYDTLRDLMPQERGNKASKWEILSKAISEHKRHTNMIGGLNNDNMRLREELEEARREIAGLREENRTLRGGNYAGQPASHHQAAPSSFGYQADYDRRETTRDYRPLEPPTIHGSDSMNGVQYSNQSAPSSSSYYQREPLYGRN